MASLRNNPSRSSMQKTLYPHEWALIDFTQTFLILPIAIITAMYHARVVVLALIMLLTSLHLVAGAPLFHSSGALKLGSGSAEFTSASPARDMLSGVQASSTVAVDERRTATDVAAALNDFIPEWVSNLTKRTLTKRARSIRRRHHSSRHP
ncbi:hypothetical protein FPV67DRAFT_1093335 [Lyophyllum atratum]|nr:hypothetical protein FPV67DRAFT_1093335 [Lyophyllum atratum]